MRLRRCSERVQPGAHRVRRWPSCKADGGAAARLRERLDAVTGPFAYLRLLGDR